MNIYQKAINHYGTESQLLKAIEEMAELTVELAKGLNKDVRLDKIEDEIADVEIIITCLREVFNFENIDKQIAFKLNRLDKRIKMEEESMSKELRLPLKKQWFEMTKSGVKTEEYREITPYWCNRLLLFEGKVKSKKWWEGLEELTGRYFISEIKSNMYITFKPFTTNTLTLGYPKSTDKSRIIKYEHKGIEIREGNPEWGAEKGKLYFVIKHGGRIDE